MITRSDLETAKPWQLFEGKAESPRPGLEWALFEGDWNFAESADDRMKGLGLRVPKSFKSPQRDDAESEDDTDDTDAYLAFLQKGGALLCVPDSDEPDEKYFRFVAVKRAK